MFLATRRKFSEVNGSDLSFLDLTVSGGTTHWSSPHEEAGRVEAFPGKVLRSSPGSERLRSDN